MNNGRGGGTGATGVFPAAYVARPEQGPQPLGYAPPEPTRGRGRPPGGPVKPRRMIDYPRWGRTGFTRWLPSWKLIAGLTSAGILTMMIGLFAAYSATSLPEPDAAAAAESTVIYFNDGKTPIDQLATQNRQIVDSKQIPETIRKAVIAAEDNTFLTNSGIDPTSIARAAWSNLRGNSLQGGSTISQQYVKNVYDQRDRSLKRKAKEIFLAVKINQNLDKNEILTRYLNTIYFGRGAYGVEAAAHAYFGEKTSAKDLNVSQAALLAGVINAPSLADDPDTSQEERDRAERRWGVVLDAMVTEGFLDANQRASQKFPKVYKQASAVTLTGQNGYLRDMVVAEAEKLGLTEDKLMTGGYKITTTFNARMMKASVAAVKQMLPKDKPKGLQIGMASVDPATGAVRAIYGGSKYVGKENNNATIARAQAGSTFKAFGLMAALEDGVSLKTEYDSDSPVKIGKSSFRNAGDGESSGYQDLVTGTRKSLNTIYVQLNNDVGPRKMAEAAYAAGIPKSAKIEETEIGNVLGSADPHALDVASAYATFAAEGIRRTPYTIEKITRIGTGEKIYPKNAKETKGTRVFEQDAVADLNYALQQVVANGTGSYAQALGRPVAGKTGTSTASRSAWFAGYTPQLSTSVMMYQLGKVKVNGKSVTVNVPMDGFGEFSSVFGGGYPIRIWTEFMQRALNGKPVENFADPVFGGEITNKAPVIIETTQAPEVTQDPNPRPTREEPTEQPDPPDNPNPEPTFPSPPDTGNPTPTVQPTGDDGDDEDGQNGGNGGGNGGNGNGNGNGNQ